MLKRMLGRMLRTMILLSQRLLSQVVVVAKALVVVVAADAETGQWISFPGKLG